MEFSIDKTIPILTNTPKALDALIRGLPAEWTEHNEGAGTWSVFDVVGHLVHGEKTDWIPRLDKILNQQFEIFEPFDRFAQFEDSKGKTIDDLLEEFAGLRAQNLEMLRSKGITDHDYFLIGIHPDFGEVTLRELLATWAVHDLDHIAQIARIMAHQYHKAVGPWEAYLRIVRQTA